MRRIEAESLQVGDRVRSPGGITGTVDSADAFTVTIRWDDGVTARSARYALWQATYAGSSIQMVTASADGTRKEEDDGEST